MRVRIIFSGIIASCVAVAASASALEGHFYYEQTGGDDGIYQRCSFTGPFRQIYGNFTSWNSQGAVVCSNYNNQYSHVTTHIGAPTCNGSTSQRVRIRTSDTIICSGSVAAWTSFSGCSALAFSRLYWPEVTFCEDKSFTATSWGT
jgi:hypothetical protein